MEEDQPQAKRWAVLIGINFYVKDRPLKGCVRDVTAIDHYLRAGQKPSDIDIVRLTATEPLDAQSQHPEERPELLPTYENLTQSLKRTLNSSKPGDLVYVHFSGHGTRNPHSGALALVLFDHEHGERYFYGQTLASILERMMGKGLFVTLVLDCCFSGSALRHHNLSKVNVRVAKYNSATDAAYPSGQLGADSIYEPWPWRDGYALPQWLVSPNYTVLTACGPHEIAEELEVKVKSAKVKERRGALSYFLLEALISLEKSGLQVTHLSLHQHLLAKFHTYWPRQTPMRRGNKDLSFFGRLQIGSDLLFVPVFKTNDGRVCLDAGHAHDVHEGDQYTLFPFHTSESTRDQAQVSGFKFQVDTAGYLTSDLVATDAASMAAQVQPGWKARLLTRFPSWSIPVHISTSLSNKARWMASAKERSSLRLYMEDESEGQCLFSVICNESDEYEILDASHKKILGSTSIPVYKNSAIEHALDVLEHLAKFKRFESIGNRVPVASFEQSFSISSECLIGPAGSYDINHGNEWQFSVENRNDAALYLTIFDLCPSKQIKNLVSDTDGGLVTVEPRGKFEGSVMMQIPEFLESQGHTECIDVMKFFITSKPTGLPAEILPEIPPLREKLRDNSHNNSDELTKCLSLLEFHLRGAGNDPWNRGWASRNFLIRTVI